MMAVACRGLLKRLAVWDLEEEMVLMPSLNDLMEAKVPPGSKWPEY